MHLHMQICYLSPFKGTSSSKELRYISNNLSMSSISYMLSLQLENIFARNGSRLQISLRFGKIDHVRTSHESFIFIVSKSMKSLKVKSFEKEKRILCIIFKFEEKFRNIFLQKKR